MAVFQPFHKVHRLFRDVIITEKIDGTNSGITIERYNDFDGMSGGLYFELYPGQPYVITPQSRNRILTPDSDNFGFARWVYDNAASLISDLGEGVHFGEWWGLGIQRGYDQDEKHFSLFNTTRWDGVILLTENLRVTPVLYEGVFNQDIIHDCVEELRWTGSVAAPGFMRPEGVITFHKPSNTMFKTTLEGDDASKYELEHK